MSPTRRAPRPRIEERLARRGGALELLRAPAALFGAAARLRAALYERRLLPVEALGVPVVAVGNLSAGGTGKTPMAVWVARELLRRGRRPGLVSRGYRGRAGEPNDEARAVAELLPDLPHAQDPDRARAGRLLVARGCDALVLDDAFQHRRVGRDLDLVLEDATRPWGLPAPPDGGAPVRALLPRGLLREPPGALARADALVLTRCDQACARELDVLRAELARWAPGRPLCESLHRPVRLRPLAGGGGRPLGELAGARVELVSGLGNPRAFERTVAELGARIESHRAFPDHHAYAAADLDGLGDEGRLVLTTAKDAVKLRALEHPALRAAAVLDVELEVRAGAPVLAALLDALPEGEAARGRRALHEGLHG